MTVDEFLDSNSTLTHPKEQWTNTNMSTAIITNFTRQMEQFMSNQMLNKSNNNYANDNDSSNILSTAMAMTTTQATLLATNSIGSLLSTTLASTSTTSSTSTSTSTSLSTSTPTIVSMNGTNSTGTEDFDEIYREIQNLVAIIVPIIFGIIAVTGFFGNSLVILVVVFNRQMQSTTNLLIVNLAIADLLFVVFCVPFTATDYVTDVWPFGNPWCQTVQYLIVVTAYASIYTLVLMSIDRFLAVVHPIRSRMLRTEHITKIAIATLWVVILTISIPVPLSHGLLTQYDKDTHKTYVLCQFLENELITQSVYQISFLASSYLLPLMVISGLYLRMIMRLWRNGVRMSVESQRGRKRVTRLVVVVVIAFASLWLPVQLLLMLRALGLFYPDTKFKVILLIMAQTLAYTSSCINPLLYAFLSENFRKAFHKAIHCSRRYQNYSTDLPPPRRTSCARTSTTGI